jgi:3-deoxy-D-manno-octulosonic-acid transferase
MMWFLYNLIFPLVFVLMLPKFLLRMARRGGYKKHFEQRLGIYGHGVSSLLEQSGRIWIHAVSVGEINVALSFIDEYRSKHPDALFVLSTNTSTAHAIGTKKLDERDALIYFPLDMPPVIRKAFDAIRPSRLVLVECELWPNLIREAGRREIPVSLINGRMSDSSFSGYKKLRSFTRRILPVMNPICVQGQQDADRFVELGAHPDTVNILGTAKYDIALPAENADAKARQIFKVAGAPDDALVLTGGSTWPEEEKSLCAIYKKLKPKYPNLFLVLIPRHVERREEVLADIQELGLRYTLRSEASGPADVLVVDTTGEIMDFYAASDVVFVGKSLCEHGGQNPIEPAVFANAIVVGPNMENFPSVMQDFLASDALLQVENFQALEEAIENLLSDSNARKTLGDAARSVVDSRRGAVGRMVEAVYENRTGV